jgi:hypothetical protein
MEISYFDHAQVRMKERHISEADVLATIAEPDKTEPSVKGRTKFTKKIEGQKTPVRVIAKLTRMSTNHYSVYTVY